VREMSLDLKHAGMGASLPRLYPKGHSQQNALTYSLRPKFELLDSNPIACNILKCYVPNSSAS
jgi:hypothetical protein